MTFFWDINKGAFAFTEKEEKVMRWLLNLLVKHCPKTCAFVNLLNLDKIKFYWAPSMTSDNGIIGAWNITTPNRIYLRFPEYFVGPGIHDNNTSRSGCITDVNSFYRMSSILNPEFGCTLIHELIHKFQFQVHPIAYIANRLVTLFIDRIPFLEQLGMEYDARDNSETEEIEEFLSDLTNSVMAYGTAIMFKTPDDPENTAYAYWNGTDITYGEPPYSDEIRKLSVEFVDIINEPINK